MRARAVFLLGLTAAILLGSALRLHTRAQATVNGTIRPLDSDSAYHMRRARFAAAHFPRTIVFDPLINFPQGGVAIWPPLFDLALAAPALLAHGREAPAAAVQAGAAWVPVALAAASIALAGLLGRALFKVGGGIFCALFLAVCPGHILWTQYAHTDQHVAESFCGLLVLLTFLRSRAHPGSAGNGAREAAAGLALSVAVLTWQGAIYWGAIIALSLVLERIRGGGTVLRAADLALGVPAAATALATAAWLSWLAPPLTYISFGFFQPLFLAALTGAVAALDLLISAARREHARGRLLAGALVVLAAAGATLPHFPQLTAGLFNGLRYSAGTSPHEVVGATGYVSYPKNWLKGIFETRPLLSGGPALAIRQLSLGFFLAPLAVLVWAARGLRGARPGIHITLAVWGSVTLFLALAQRLNVYYAAPLCALVLVEAARAAATRLRRRLRPDRRRRAAVVAAGVGLLLALPMRLGLSAELAATYAPGSDLFHTLDRMRAELPRAIDAYDPRLLGPPPFPRELDRAFSVLAPWSMGHWILYDAELPVVANNFGYGFMDSIRFFLAESESEALAIARQRRVRWILATDLAPRMNDYASYFDRPPYFEAGPQRMPSPAYFKTMQARLYEFDGKGATFADLTVAPVDGVRLLFHSQSAIRRGGRWVALWKVFEVVEDPGHLGP
ncbi:MAG: STT3 domain-containing protein [Acidobacteriota bacterium]